MLDLPLLNIETYYKALQSMYKAIKEVDTIAMIIQYKLEEDGEELIEENESRIGVIAKHVLLNYEEALPKYL